MAISIDENTILQTPAGKFRFEGGSFVPVEEFASRYKGEEWVKPWEQVPLQVMKYNVTVQQYAEFLKENPAYPKPSNWTEQVAQGDNYAVTNVNLYDAQAYCKWRSERDGKTIRLPTEAEWMFIASAEVSGWRKYPWGNEEPTPERANYWGDKRDKQIPVGCLPKGDTPSGIADLAGGVWEWVAGLWYGGSK